VVIAEGSLSAADGDRLGTITVTARPVQTGLVPPVPNFSDSCPVAEAGLQYVPVDVESGDGSERYCFDYPPLPTSDRFWNQMGARTVTGYVVLDEAVTAATPGGRSDVFDDPSQVQRLAVDEMSVGAVCPRRRRGDLRGPGLTRSRRAAVGPGTMRSWPTSRQTTATTR